MSSPEFNDETSLDIDTSCSIPIEQCSVKELALENQPVMNGRTSRIDVLSNTNHDVVVNEAKKWISELETMRDEMYLLSVKNAVLLDSLAMAGECAGS